MFEDALVESCGKLRSRSKRWMLATSALNLSIVAIAILLPLLHPEALPRTLLTATLTVPPPPPAPAPAARTEIVHATHSVAPLNAMVTPSHVPKTTDTRSDPPPPSTATSTAVAGAMGDSAGAGSVLSALGTATAPVEITARPERPKVQGPVNVSSGVAAGYLAVKVTPVYPAIARAAHVAGTVTLHAVISKQGGIERLQVVAGPEMLRASALDAVRQWQYRPYLLNGAPTEVETTVTVNFTLGG